MVIRKFYRIFFLHWAHNAQCPLLWKQTSPRPRILCRTDVDWLTWSDATQRAPFQWPRLRCGGTRGSERPSEAWRIRPTNKTISGKKWRTDVRDHLPESEREPLEILRTGYRTRVFSQPRTRMNEDWGWGPCLGDGSMSIPTPGNRESILFCHHKKGFTNWYQWF